ncbi:SDR family oxidoreductase [bacterium]|nr:SDR family oxidoreductase [bacterium]
MASAKSFIGKTAILCGGSKGIGKETAKQIARLGGNVCIVARNQDVLLNAAEEIRLVRLSEAQFVETIAADTTKPEEIQQPLIDFVEKHGAPDFLINAVGYAYPEYISNLKLVDFERNMQTNYFGQLVPTQILLPYFVEARRGHISFVSSMLGYMGLVGYATYAPSKFALVGLAEVLRHELKPYGIRISILYPPDTNTPGFEIENQTKPKETAMLSETAKLFSPEKVAEAYVKGLLKNQYHIMIGEGKWIWRATRLAPRLVHMILDNDYKKARQKLGKTDT